MLDSAQQRGAPLLDASPGGPVPAERPAIRVLIVTGISGAGKSTALRALEDVGYYCVDNLPLPLLTQFVGLLSASGKTQAALVIDARLKPHHAPPLVEDPQVSKRVDALAAPGGPLHGIF